jgi:hypothetical protein
MATSSEGNRERTAVNRKQRAPDARRPGRNPRKRKEDARRKAFWGVFDHLGNRVTLFEYSQRADAEAKARELSRQNAHFVSLVKEELKAA